jgi:hypothetical protein
MTRSTIDPGKSRKPFRATLAWVLILLLFAHSGAASQDCEVIAKNGEPRDCTFTEELADCALDVIDSFEQCMDDADGYFETAACEITQLVDNGACVIATPFRWGFDWL